MDSLNDMTTAEIIEATRNTLCTVSSPSRDVQAAIDAIKTVLGRIPDITIKLDERAVINGVSAVIKQNWSSKKFYWAIGGVNPRDEHFDTAQKAFVSLKAELSKRGLICLLSFDAS